MDPTETIRREMVAAINEGPPEREELERNYGRVWNTRELQNDFVVHSFLAPFVCATHKQTGKKGTLVFRHHPRYYFEWLEDRK